MAFGAHVLKQVEDFLADAFQYHDQLDAFLLRSGVSRELLRAARREATDKNERRGRFPNAPKRYVAQELITELSHRGHEEEAKIISNLVTAICNFPTKDLPATARDCVAALREIRDQEGRQKAELTKQKEEKRKEEQANQEYVRSKATEQAELKRKALLGDFYTLCAQSNAQARGYALEKLLNELFEFEGLSPKGSFKNIGEQIDGSFAFKDQTHLVEAKWTEALAAGASFGAFMYKIEGKTADTRGLLVSINGYSSEALTGLKMKGGLKFICIDGAHLTRALSPHQSLKKVLHECWRHADETGESYLPVSRMRS